MTKQLLIVCDDAGFASVDRGIVAFVEKTGVPVCAEYLIETEGAIERAKEMKRHPLVSVGLHFELSRLPDAERVALARKLKAEGTTLGEQAEIRAMATQDAVNQLAIFRQAMAHDPLHVSTHGDFNVDLEGNVMPWWMDLMKDLFPEGVPPMQWGRPVIRHNKYSWNLDATKREPFTPDEFEAELQKQKSDIVEFVLHPAIPKSGDTSIEMLFTADMRIADLEAAIAIVQSGCIERAGFEIIAVSALA